MSTPPCCGRLSRASVRFGAPRRFSSSRSCSHSSAARSRPGRQPQRRRPPQRPRSRPRSRGWHPSAAPKWRLASDPAQLADDLVADEHALRDPSSSEAVLMAAARRQQAAYRALGRHPEWDPIARPRIPPSLLEIYDRNVDARRQLTAMTRAERKTHCLRGASTRRRRPTSCWVTTARRNRRPASAGPIWRRST